MGVGTPGFLQPGRGLIRNSNLQSLNDRPLDKDLEAALGRPVRLANDAKCFVLSEAIDGAAAAPSDLDRSRPDVVFGATLGTGVGGGIVVDGRVLTGQNGAATEWSHTTLPFLQPGEESPYVCFCGHPGCIESFISGRGLAATYRRLGGQDLDGAEVGRREAARDPLAERAFGSFEDWLARALSLVINLVDPRAIVLGGGVSNNERISATCRPSWSGSRWPSSCGRGSSARSTETPAAPGAPPCSGERSAQPRLSVRRGSHHGGPGVDAAFQRLYRLRAPETSIDVPPEQTIVMFAMHSR